MYSCENTFFNEIVPNHYAEQCIIFIQDNYILQELLPSSLLEQFQEKEDEYLWIQEILTEQELIVDSTEQSIYRPYSDDKQKKYYSGKKKNHTFTNNDYL